MIEPIFSALLDGVVEYLINYPVAFFRWIAFGAKKDKFNYYFEQTGWNLTLLILFVLIIVMLVTKPF